MDAKLL